MIKITAKNFKLTDGLRSSIVNKLERFEKLLPNDELIDVILETKAYGQKIEVFFRINNRLIKAESIDNDLYVAIDLVVDKLKRQISKYSGKLSNNATESIKFAEMNKINDKEERTTPSIVKRKYISKKPMMEEEAILQMELLGHKSFLFFNADTDSTAMIYKRNDGNYGIITED